jgi:hypothetical protein
MVSEYLPRMALMESTIIRSSGVKANRFRVNIVAYANRVENLAVILASDHLNDLSVGIASYY